MSEKPKLRLKLLKCISAHNVNKQNLYFCFSLVNQENWEIALKDI